MGPTAVVDGIELCKPFGGLLDPCPRCGHVYQRREGLNEATGETKLVCSGCSTAYFCPPDQSRSAAVTE